jgi:hypothetical protein
MLNLYLKVCRQLLEINFDYSIWCLELDRSGKRIKYVTEHRPSSTLSMIMNSSRSLIFMTNDANESCKSLFLEKLFDLLSDFFISSET